MDPGLQLFVFAIALTVVVGALWLRLVTRILGGPGARPPPTRIDQKTSGRNP